MSAGGLVPCGRCTPCRLNRRKHKTSRNVLEAHNAKDILFVTATYDDNSLPTSYTHFDGRFYCNLGGTLNPRHPQLFIKRLRAAVSPVRFRVSYVGEYGENTLRPHYHFIFFDYPPDQTWRMYESWHDEGRDDPMCAWERFTIEKPNCVWDVSQYTSGYVVKKMTKHDDPRLDGRFPEFFRSSKGLGLAMVPHIVQALDTDSGWSYIYENGNIPRSMKLSGRSVTIDRYMKEKILDGLEEIQPGIKEKIKAICYQNYQAQMQDLQLRSKEAKTSPLKVLEADNAQPLKVLERKFELFNSKKGKL